MEGRQRPLAQAEKADTRRGPGGVPEGSRRGLGLAHHLLG